MIKKIPRSIFYNFRKGKRRKGIYGVNGKKFNEKKREDNKEIGKFTP